jgi:NAD(P)-dependent dehydrogenase (short-subunit alcohol dehydrogenase family)
MTDTPAIRDVVDRSFAGLERVDVIVRNAGYGLFGAAEELTDEQFEHIVAANLTGAIHLIRAVLPHLRAQGGGRIIQISSYGCRSRFPATRSTTQPSGGSRDSSSSSRRRSRRSGSG